MKPSVWDRRRIFTVVFFTLLSLFALTRLEPFYRQAFSGFAWDFAINRTAAHGLLAEVSPYDRAALHQLAIAQIPDQNSEKLFNGRFTSFVGLPSTAMFHLPFTAMSFDSSVLWYRVSALLAMLLSVFLVGCAVHKTQRAAAWLTGLLCLLLWHAVSFSLRLGQVDAWVLLSLATTIFALSRKQWAWAGVALSFAVILKISPVWLLLYCVLKKQWRVLGGFSIAAALFLALILPTHRSDFYQFFATVLPSLGDSPIHPQNQSLAAAMARLFSADNTPWSFAVGVGAWKFVGLALAVTVLLLRYIDEKRVQAITAAGCGVALLCALMAGPLTWDHYLAWAIIPVMLLAARIHSWQYLVLFVILIPMYFSVPYPNADAVAAHAVWRVLTTVQIISLSIVSVWLAVMTPSVEDRNTE
jgi:hypothetical protein